MESVKDAKQPEKKNGKERCPWLVTKLNRERFGTVMDIVEYPWCQKTRMRPSPDICKTCLYKYELLDLDELPLEPKLRNLVIDGLNRAKRKGLK